MAGVKAAPEERNRQTSLFLKDSTFEWHVLKLAWLGKGRRAIRFGVFLNGVGLNGIPYGVSNLLVSLGHTGRRVVVGHTLKTQTLMKTDEQKKGFK